MAPSLLGARMRDLRHHAFPGRTVNQDRVAEALGVRPPSISAYENGTLPPLERLRDYAIFFASVRWLEQGSPRRAELAFLNPDELSTFNTLHAELLELRRVADAAASPDAGAAPVPFWRFPDGAPVRILCGRLSPSDAEPYGRPTDHNHMWLRNAADLDSLVELWGHIRRLNPDSDVRFVLGGAFSSGDLQSHVVVLGNLAQTQGEGRLLPRGTLPVRQVDVDGLDGEIFEFKPGDEPAERFYPVLESRRVVEDVGLLARLPNPFFTTRTFTVCSGVFTRGVYGAVRSLTDKGLRDSNAAYIRDAFADDTSFGLLMKVRVAGDAVPTPDLRYEDNRLREFDLLRRLP